MADNEHRFILHERLFQHMASFRASGYRYYFTPKDLAFEQDDQTVNTFALDEIVFDSPQDKTTSELLNPSKVEMVKPPGKKRYALETEPAHDLKIKISGKKYNTTKIKSPNGVPFAMYFGKSSGSSIAPASKLAEDGGAEVPTINCCTSTLSAFYTEWKRVMHAGEANDNATAKARRLSSRFHQYFMVIPSLPDAKGAGAVACDVEAKIAVRDGAQAWLADLRNMRRGDIAQVFWNGYEDAHWEQCVIKHDAQGIPYDEWERCDTEPDCKPSEKRQVRDFDYAGHSVFVHDVVLHEGKVWFHMLSAQGNDTSSGGTRGVGLAGSGRDAYAVGDAALEAELFGKANCYTYEQDNRSKAYKIIPEMFVGRLRRPFPCWPVALAGAPAAKIPLPAAFQGAGYVSNLHPDDVAFAPGSAYHANCEQAGSGYYPMGLSRAWHGGVHLRVAAGSAVRAVADGVIVAVRNAIEGGSGPSRNFVLIRHQVRQGEAEKVFYTLAMHLRGEKPGARPLEPRWLWQFDRKPEIKGYQHPNAEALAKAGVVCLAYPIGAGEIIGHSDGAYVHVEVFAPQDIVDASYPDKRVLADGDADLLYDSKKLLALLADQGKLGDHLKSLTPGPGAAQSGVVLQQEIVEFFTSGSDQPRAVLRGLVTKHVSEWSQAVSWPALKDTEAWGYYDEPTAKALEAAQARNAWLSREVATWARLPASGILFHYHPIAFIDWLAAKTTSGAIEPLVQKVSEILDGGAVPVATADVQQPEAASAPSPTAAASPAPVRWEIDPAAGVDQLAVGTLDSEGRFNRLRREIGPWTQAGEPRLSSNGHSEFVPVGEAANEAWICVRSGQQRYARRQG